MQFAQNPKKNPVFLSIEKYGYLLYYLSTKKQIVHPIVENRKDEILCCNVTNLDIDTSYYLNNDELGILNAFEEYTVRVLTDAIVSGDVPENLDVFLDQEISKRHKLNWLSDVFRNERNILSTNCKFVRGVYFALNTDGHDLPKGIWYSD